MKILFFFVHPSKFHLFRYTINQLIKNGHDVEITIITKDVLEQLVKGEGWKYTNIFPEGRRIEGLPILLSTSINFIKTIWRLLKFTAGKKYDLFVTDDCLTIIGKLKSIPSLYFTDDDITVVPEYSLLMKPATHIIAPNCTELGSFSKKKLGFKGYKELAYLHPDYFTPDIEKIKTFNPSLKPFAILRLVSLTASHDRDKKGISDTDLQKIISMLSTKYEIYISAERALSKDFEKYRLQIPPENIAHVLYFAELFIGDSQTMSSEAAVLGTPTIRINDFVGKISVMEEKETKFDLYYGFKPKDFNKIRDKIEILMQEPDLKKKWADKKKKMLGDCENINQFIYSKIISLQK